MTNIILHIGRHKTGTTSLQHFLAINDELLANRFDILYPRSGRDSWNQYHHPVFQGLIEKNHRLDPSLVESILNEADRRGISNILLSSEMLSRPTVTEEQLQEIRRSFSGYQLTIVVYLRRQDEFLQSTYAERVKRGLLAAPCKAHDIDAGLDYYQFINKYASVFGAESIIIKSFECAVKTGLYKDFLEVLGVSLDSEFAMPKKNANEHWPWLYVELVRYANATKLTRKIATHQWVVSLVLRINRLFPVLMNKPKPLSLREKLLIVEKYEESNAKLAREFLNQSELF